MASSIDVALLVGSLRKESLNRKLAMEVATLGLPTLTLDLVEIGTLPLYNQDLDASPPGEWSRFRDRIRAADAVLFVTPEYNRSVPGALKNALDVGSRPYGKNAWDGKPAAIVSVSPGAIGGFGANHHLRQSLVFLNMPAMQQPEAYIGNAATLFDAQNKLNNDATRDFLSLFLRNFAGWIASNSRRQPEPRPARAMQERSV